MLRVNATTARAVSTCDPGVLGTPEQGFVFALTLTTTQRTGSPMRCTAPLRSTPVRLLAAVLVSAAVLVAPAPPAAAHPIEPTADTVNDPNDVSGRLDIKFARVAARGSRVILKIRTYQEWGCRYLKGNVTDEAGRSASLRWHLDTDGDHGTDHSAFAKCGDGRFRFRMSEAEETFPATRPDRRTFRVVLPRHRFGLDNSLLRAIAISRVDRVSEGQVLFDHEDTTRALRPYRG